MWRRRVLRWGVPLYMGLEACFYQYYGRKREQLSAERNEGPETDVTGMVRRIMKGFEERGWGPAEYQGFISGWFRGARFDDIGHQNAEQWFAYMLYMKYPKDLEPHERHCVDYAIECMEKKAQVQFKAGRTDVKAMAHNLDPIMAMHTPLCLYVVVGLLNTCTSLALRASGFERFHVGHIPGWYHSNGHACPGTDAAAPDPIVLIQGLGIGMLPYLYFVRKVLRQCQRPLLLVELPYVSLSMRNFFPDHQVPSIAEVVTNLSQVLQDHGYSKACFIGHSYGTNYITWLNRHRPELLSSGVVLVDPIGFLLFEPDLIDNMLYQNSFSGPASFVIRRELYVRYTIQRHFWWMQNTLFPDSLPEKAAVMLGDRDNIVPTHKIYRYLQESAGRRPLCEMFTCKHGGLVYMSDMQDRIIEIINGWHRSGPSTSGGAPALT